MKATCFQNFHTTHWEHVFRSVSFNSGEGSACTCIRIETPAKVQPAPSGIFKDAYFAENLSTAASDNNLCRVVFICLATFATTSSAPFEDN